MEFIKKTNQTILLKKVSNQANDLLTLLTGTEGGIAVTDKVVKEVKEALLVHSFAEYMEKFGSSLYVYVDTEKFQFYLSSVKISESPMQMFQIVLNKENALVRQLVADTDLTGMQRSTYDIWEHFGEALFSVPERQKFKEDLRAIRKIFHQYLEEFCDIAYFEDALVKFLKRYDEGVFLLPFFVQNGIQARAEHLRTGRNASIWEKTQVKVLYEIQEEVLTKKQYIRFKEVVESSLAELPLCNPTLLMYCIGVRELEGENMEECAEQFNRYADFYHELVKACVREVIPMLEDLLNVKAFFQQYQTEHRIMPPALLVANCEPEKFLDPKYRERFELYLATVNEKNQFDSTIWFAILPGLKIWRNRRDKLTRERFRGTRQDKSLEMAFQEKEIQMLTGLMAKYKILLFASCKEEKKGTVSYLREHGIQPWQNVWEAVLQDENSQFLIPCYPNFTVIAREHSMIETAGVYRMTEQGRMERKDTDTLKLYFNGIYIEASYVAAGFFAACQCPGFLNQFYEDQVDMELPGVAYEPVKGNQNKVIKPVIGREAPYFPEETMKKIQEEAEGIVFAPVEKGNLTIVTSRTHAYERKDETSVSDIQLHTYMKRMIQAATQDFKKDMLQDFIEEYEKKHKGKEGHGVNAIPFQQLRSVGLENELPSNQMEAGGRQ